MTDKPIFFERNRVGRVYTGGKLFADLFGDADEDNFEPEEWIASAVKAIKKEQKSEKEGVSKIKDSDLYFDELLEKYPNELLGKAGKLRILVKALDSAIRLPAQAHPDKEFSRKYFNSDYGKTECWTILGLREGAKLYFGFKDGVTKEDFEAAIDKSETDPTAMEKLMKEIYPKVGDTYLVPAKTVHAIGAGCLILEIQEPTDFTIQPEHFCGEYKLNEKEMYLSLNRQEAVSCFDFTDAPDTKMKPEIIEKGDGLVKENVVGAAHTDCFVINRIKLDGGEYSLKIEDSYGVYIVTEGAGEIKGENYSKKIKKGDYFFLPACLMGKFKASGNLEITECY